MTGLESLKSNGKNISMLKWRCRRGMLELDILLTQYLVENAQQFSEQEYNTFEELLAYPDQVLYDLLFKEIKSSDPAIKNLIQKIRLVK